MLDSSFARRGGADLTIPRDPSAITPEWMTEALRSAEVITRSRVVSIKSKIIGEGKGFTGPVARINLAYDIKERNAPKSLIGKFPVADAKLRTILNFSRLFEREILFYSELAGRIPIRTPRCYYSALDTEEVESVLLLEDLGKSQTSTNTRRWPLKYTQIAIEQLAMFHATWWNSPRLDEIAWMPAIGENADASQELFIKYWRHRIDDLSKEMSSIYIEVAEKLQGKVVKICNYLGTPPRTMTHGDFRPNNLFFASGQGGDSLAIIDWQIATRGRGASDIAYFMMSFPTTYRRAHEMQILETYSRILEKCGIPSYHIRDCIRDYRFSILYVLIRLIAGQGFFLNLPGVSGRTIHQTRLQRCIRAVKDHDLLQLAR